MSNGETDKAVGPDYEIGPGSTEIDRAGLSVNNDGPALQPVFGMDGGARPSSRGKATSAGRPPSGGTRVQPASPVAIDPAQDTDGPRTGEPTGSSSGNATEASTREAWPKDPDARETSQLSTIETVASNFMVRVDQTEKDNERLLDDNQRLLQKMKEADLREERLGTETRLLKSEHAELTMMTHTLKTENSELLKKVSDLNRDMDEQMEVFREERDEMRVQMRELQSQKKSLDETLNDLDMNVQEQQLQMDEDASLISQLKDQVTLRDSDSNKQDKVGKRLKDIEAQNSKSKDEITRLNAENKKLKEENDVLSKAQKATDEKKLVVQKRDKQIYEFKETVERMTTELEELRQQVTDNHEKEQATNEKFEQLSEMEQEISRLKATVRITKEEQKKSTDECALLKADLEIQGKLTDELRKKTTDVMQEKRKLENQLTKSRQDLDHRKTAMMLPKTDNTEVEKLKRATRELTEKNKNMREVVKSKDEHISDLRSEVDDLRNSVANSQREIDQLRSSDREEILSDKYEDMAGIHRRLLDENKRLRGMVATKAMEETNTGSERSEMVLELERTNKQLMNAQRRIRQLESWMDEIFENDEFEVVNKDRGKSVMSLPTIPYTSSSDNSPRRRQTNPNKPKKTPKKPGSWTFR